MSGEIGSRKSPMGVPHMDVHRGGREGQPDRIHDATRNSPFCHRGPGFSGAAGGHGLMFHWRVPVMGQNGTDMYSCTAQSAASGMS